MTIKAFDIETIPNQEMLPYLPEPTVALGNTKDPIKVAAKMDEAREKQIEKAGLDPMFARLFCASFGNGNGKIVDELTDEKEAELIDWIFEELSGGDVRLQTYNGNHFDLPFLFKRAMILKVDVKKWNLPTLADYTKKYNNDLHEDLMLHFPKVSNSAQCMKLDDVAGVIFGEHKNEIDYKEFPAMMMSEAGRQEILDYCNQDVDLTAKLGAAMKGYLFN